MENDIIGVYRKFDKLELEEKPFILNRIRTYCVKRGLEWSIKKNDFNCEVFIMELRKNVRDTVIFLNAVEKYTISWEIRKQLIKAINNCEIEEIENIFNDCVDDFDEKMWEIFSNAPLFKGAYSEGFLDKVKKHYKEASKDGILNNISLRAILRLETLCIDEKSIERVKK